LSICTTAHPTSYQIHEHIWYLYFGSDDATEPQVMLSTSPMMVLFDQPPLLEGRAAALELGALVPQRPRPTAFVTGGWHAPARRHAAGVAAERLAAAERPAGLPIAEWVAVMEVPPRLVLGRIVALYHRSSTSYQIH
jgi:hypothetical protein